ncbi:MAG: hypothetical protein R2710_15190 [Acidimicrobiales bacterium]
MAKAEGNCAIDYGFHMAMADVNASSLKEMDTMVDEGLSSFKLFMAYPGSMYSDDGQILRAMQQAAGNGGMIMMHAENGIAIDVLAEQAVERGETAPIHHGYARREALESEAVHRAIKLARVGAAPLYIVHLSASEALEEVARARTRGANVFAETCPHYLYLSLEDHLGKPGFDGAGYVCSTPLRSKHEHHAADLWKGLRTDELSVVSTDHCPFCMNGQKDLERDDFRLIPNGIGGVEHRMDLISSPPADLTRSMGRAVLDSPRFECSGSIPARVSSSPGPMPTSSCTTRRPPVDQRRQPSHEPRLLGLRRLRAHRQGRHRAVRRGRVIVEHGQLPRSPRRRSAFLRRGLSSYLR